MSETRDPSKGSWTVFEGDRPKTQRENSIAWGAGNINSDIEWPIVLRVHRIRGGVMESVDVEVGEDFSTKVERESLVLRES